MTLLTILGWSLAAFAAWLVAERVLARILPPLGRYLPDDLCGPDGWFFDTDRGVGIFDALRNRRNG